MPFQSSSHFDPTSLLIVRKEIDQSIKHVENGASALLEDGSAPFGLDDALTNLEQCSHVLRLVEQPQLGQLTELTAKVMKKVIEDTQAGQVDQARVEAMSEATNVTKRYLDFLCVRETLAPQFLLPTINKLEASLQLPLTREGVFLTPFLETVHPNVAFDAPADLPKSKYVQRLYKLSLLNLLKMQETDLDFQALSLCSNYLSSIATGTPSEQYWRFVHIALRDLDQIILTETRLRVLVQIEQQSHAFLNDAQFSPTQQDYADILVLCMSQESQLAQQLREQLNVHDEVLSDDQMQVLSRQLYGPDLDTIQTVVELLNDQIKSISNRIETGQYIQQDNERQEIVASLREAVNIFQVINLNDSAAKLRSQADQIEANENLSSDKHANDVMSSLLFASNSLQILERNYTPARLKLKFNNTQITLDKIEEAQMAVCDEARISLTKVSEQIVQYQQTQDNEQLTGVADILREVSGALLFLESDDGHKILQKTAQLVDQITTQQKSFDPAQLKLLAQSIASAAYYFEQLQQNQPILARPMQIGLQSITALEQAVA